MRRATGRYVLDRRPRAVPGADASQSCVFFGHRSPFYWFLCFVALSPNLSPPLSLLSLWPRECLPLSLSSPSVGNDYYVWVSKKDWYYQSLIIMIFLTDPYIIVFFRGALISSSLGAVYAVLCACAPRSKPLFASDARVDVAPVDYNGGGTTNFVCHLPSFVGSLSIEEEREESFLPVPPLSAIQAACLPATVCSSHSVTEHSSANTRLYYHTTTWGL